MYPTVTLALTSQRFHIHFRLISAFYLNLSLKCATKTDWTKKAVEGGKEISFILLILQFNLEGWWHGKSFWAVVRNGPRIIFLSAVGILVDPFQVRMFHNVVESRAAKQIGSLYKSRKILKTNVSREFYFTSALQNDCRNNPVYLHQQKWSVNTEKKANFTSRPSFWTSLARIFPPEWGTGTCFCPKQQQ